MTKPDDFLVRLLGFWCHNSEEGWWWKVNGAQFNQSLKDRANRKAINRGEVTPLILVIRENT